MSSIHQGLKSEIIESHTGGGVEIVKARITHGRDDVAHGLHALVNTSSYSPGIRREEFLGKLGFSAGPCPFARGAESYCLEVRETFDAGAFAAIFGEAFNALQEADRHLNQCGFFLEARDFPAKQWVVRTGDGHTGDDQQHLKDSEDDHTQFVFTWLKLDGQGGWTTHYRWKEEALSDEGQSVLQFLGLRGFEQCIEFDFEACHWRHVRRESRGRGIFDGNNDDVIGWFDAHAEHFSKGVERLLAAEAAVKQFGFGFLPSVRPSSPRPRATPIANDQASLAAPGDQTEFESTRELSGQEPERAGDWPTDLPDRFDVAFSFAGTEREHAEELANLVRAAGFRVFYDKFYESELWGKHLAEFFQEVYEKRSRFCVMFVSDEYRDRMWPTHERRSAISRAVRDMGGGYILPIKVDEVELPGLSGQISYLSLATHSVRQIGALLLKKLGG